MCNFMSAIVTKTEVLWDLDIDSHEDLLSKFKLRDNTTSPEFVRVEMRPVDNDLFNHDLANWKLHVDQDLIPAWFNKEEAELAIQGPLQECFKKRFITQDQTVKEGRWFTNKARVKAYGSSRVLAYDSSMVEAYDSSMVEAYDSSEVKAYDSSEVVAYNSSKVCAYGSSTVWLHDSSEVWLHDSSEVCAHDSSHIFRC